MAWLRQAEAAFKGQLAKIQSAGCFHQADRGRRCFPVYRALSKAPAAGVHNENGTVEHNSGRFSVMILDKSYIADVIVSLDREHCFLGIHGISNGAIFNHYKIGKAKVLEVLGIDKWYGDWPETTEDKVYELINYINECRNLGSNPDKVEISGNEIITNFARLEIKQSKSGKWYISGSLENILKLFHIDDQVKLKQIVNNLFGSKRRAGVFPELDSRDDVIKLIKATQHE